MSNKRNKKKSSISMIKKFVGSTKRVVESIKQKTTPAREFMSKGRTLAMILEIVVASQFLGWPVNSIMLGKLPHILCIIMAAVVLVIFAEFLNLVIKIIFGGGKRCKSYFLTSFASVFAINMIANQANAVVGAILMSFLLVLSVDILGRTILGFIKTHRFKQIAAYIAGVLSLTYLIFFAVFYRGDCFGKSRIDFYNSIRGDIDTSATDFSTYLENGAYSVKTLSYGPDESDDMVTNTIDLTKFKDAKETEDPMTGLIRLISDKDFEKTPVKGQIWYPEGKKNCPVFFIVHGNHESSVPSYLGYEYLGTYLASNGYVVVSVDENIINEIQTNNDLRAYLLLENMKVILDLSEHSDNPLSGMIDVDKIAIGGHSRGGEMVATAYLFNELDNYPEDGNIKFDYHFNISSIVAISPVVDQYMPVGHSVEISDVNYLLLHGANDQDVSTMMGEKQYNNISFTKDSDEFNFKSSVYVLGANHGQFNSLWGQYDTPIGKGFLNTNHFLDESDQKKIAKAYIRTFLDTTLLKDESYITLFSDASSYAGDLPDTIYITNYEDSDTTVLCSFDDTVDISNYDSGANVDVTGADRWTIVPYERGNGGEGEDFVLNLKWKEKSEPSIGIDFPAIDISEGYISFGLADMREDTEKIDEEVNYKVVLTDASGNKVTVSRPVMIYPSLATQLFKQDIFFKNYEYKHQMQTVKITSKMFKQSKFDFSSVVKMTILLDGTTEGEIIIDDVGYRNY